MIESSLIMLKLYPVNPKKNTKSYTILALLMSDELKNNLLF